MDTLLDNPELRAKLGMGDESKMINLLEQVQQADGSDRDKSDDDGANLAAAALPAPPPPPPAPAAAAWQPAPPMPPPPAPAAEASNGGNNGEWQDGWGQGGEWHGGEWQGGERQGGEWQDSGSWEHEHVAAECCSFEISADSQISWATPEVADAMLARGAPAEAHAKPPAPAEAHAKPPVPADGAQPAPADAITSHTHRTEYARFLRRCTAKSFKSAFPDLSEKFANKDTRAGLFRDFVACDEDLAQLHLVVKRRMLMQVKARKRLMAKTKKDRGREKERERARERVRERRAPRCLEGLGLQGLWFYNCLIFHTR